MKRLVSLSALLISFVSISLLTAQEGLNNSSVLSMWQAGMTDTLIVRMIEQNPGAYALSANDLKVLLDNRLPDRVIQSMFTKMQRPAAGAGGENPPPTAAPKPAAPAKPAVPTSVGVFFQRGNEWVEVLPEPVTWTRSGTTNSIKKYASIGISRPPIRASLYGEHSRTILATPPVVIVNISEGTIINEFLIVPLEVTKGKREVIVGGPEKSDAAHRSIPFGVERVTATQYRIQFPNTFGPGEYGAFNINVASNAKEGDPGKMYTFRVPLSM